MKRRMWAKVWRETFGSLRIGQTVSGEDDDETQRSKCRLRSAGGCDIRTDSAISQTLDSLSDWLGCECLCAHRMHCSARDKCDTS